MKKCLGIILVVFTGMSDGKNIQVELRATSVTDSLVDATQEINSLASSSSNQEDLAGIEVILTSFGQMIGSLAQVMANLDSPTIAAAAITNIVSNTFKVIFEMAKHRDDKTLRLPQSMGIVENMNVMGDLESLERECMTDRPPFPSHASQTAHVVLNNFAHIIGNCANIAADPHNPRLIGSSIANMFAHIMAIAAYAKEAKANRSFAPEETLQELCQSQEMYTAMSAIILHHATKIRLKELEALAIDQAIA